MARRNLLAAVLAGTVLALPCAARATVASTHNIIVDISGQFAGQSGYEGLQTFAIYVQFTSPSDRLLNHGDWDFNLFGGCLVHADPVADDPLGLIDDATGGNVPIAPGIIAQPGYGAWAWDSNLSMDNSSLSMPMPGTLLSMSHMAGGAFIVPPPTGIEAGADHRVQVAQITISTALTTGCGTMMIGYTGPGLPGAVFAEISVGALSGCMYAADLNIDFSVDTLDLGILLSNWSIPAKSPGCGGDPCCRSDLNDDGVVNTLDLGILLTQWGPGF